MKRMPAIFVGHGSPMNAIEDNDFTRGWAEIGMTVPKPEAILCVSAHWTTQGTCVTDSPHPSMVYDMYGFPRSLYEVKYQPLGSPKYAHITRGSLGDIRVDNGWGLDHGAWSVLKRMYPKADIPVFQLSLDSNASSRQHFEMGQAIKALRNQGVLILGSGNVVHNLSRVNWDMDSGYAWAQEFDSYIKDCITRRDFQGVINFNLAGPSAQLAFRTTEHFDPLLYVLGASDAGDRLEIKNDSCTMGSISMTCFLFK